VHLGGLGLKAQQKSTDRDTKTIQQARDRSDKAKVKYQAKKLQNASPAQVDTAVKNVEKVKEGLNMQNMSDSQLNKLLSDLKKLMREKGLGRDNSADGGSDDMRGQIIDKPLLGKDEASRGPGNPSDFRTPRDIIRGENSDKPLPPGIVIELDPREMDGSLTSNSNPQQPKRDNKFRTPRDIIRGDNKDKPLPPGRVIELDPREMDGTLVRNPVDVQKITGSAPPLRTTLRKQSRSRLSNIGRRPRRGLVRPRRR